MGLQALGRYGELMREAAALEQAGAEARAEAEAQAQAASAAAAGATADKSAGERSRGGFRVRDVMRGGTWCRKGGGVTRQ